jgi:hypothetical protein
MVRPVLRKFRPMQWQLRKLCQRSVSALQNHRTPTVRAMLWTHDSRSLAGEV